MRLTSSWVYKQWGEQRQGRTRKIPKPFEYPCTMILPLLWLGNTIWGLAGNRGKSIVGKCNKEPWLANFVHFTSFFGGSKYSSIISIAGSSVLSTSLKIMKNPLSAIIWKDSIEWNKKHEWALLTSWQKSEIRPNPL